MRVGVTYPPLRSQIVGAEDEIRTPDPNFGTVALCVRAVQMGLLECGSVHPVSTTSSQFVAVVERSIDPKHDPRAPAETTGAGDASPLVIRAFRSLHASLGQSVRNWCGTVPVFRSGRSQRGWPQLDPN